MPAVVMLEGVGHLSTLSRAAQSLWAKKPGENGDSLWLPLAVHMADSAAAARQLWNRWISFGVKHAIETSFSEPSCADRLFIFLAAAHDLGKATPVFQSKPAWPPRPDIDETLEAMIESAGLPVAPNRSFPNASKTSHALASQVLLEHVGCDKSIAAILGSHHGKPSKLSASEDYGLATYAFNYHLEEAGREAWSAVWGELIEMALELSGFSSVSDLPKINMAGQVLLSAMVIMADWIASNEKHFPHIRLVDVPRLSDSQVRANSAWKELALPHPWSACNTWMRSDLYRERFSFQANAIQSVVLRTAKEIHTPGILVLEAPMGSGKTEAALACAEIFAYKAKRSGVFFALPTQATSDGVFPRMLDWIRSLESYEGQSIKLAHGKAQFNEDYQGLQFYGSTGIGRDDEDDVIVHEWFEGRKKSLLADFVVGTVDQLLLAALKHKHLMLRHLGLAGKVVIIDECHAYDAYMGQYLARALNWLGAYGVPVIVLSATLPAGKRRKVINAYMNRDSATEPSNDPLGRRRGTPAQPQEWSCSRSYPLVTYTDGHEIKHKIVPSDGDSRHVSIELIDENEIVDRLADLLSGGGCAGVIVNTVKRAQEMAPVLRERFGEDTVRLLHSRFLASDRHMKERECLTELGRPGRGRHRPLKRIVIGTQVLEQSLDIDFDVLITDICPMDLLLQRIGRLHRHKRYRPQKLDLARCLVLGVGDDGFESGSESIYGAYLLMRTKALLPGEILLPGSIPQLVQDTYDDGVNVTPIPAGYQEAREKQRSVIASKESRAGHFRIGPIWPQSSQNFLGWLDTDVTTSEKHGEAAVRDTDESIEVLLVRKEGIDGRYRLIGEVDGHGIPWDEMPDNDSARQIARQGIRLPPALCTPWMIDRTIFELEQLNRKHLPEWQKSPWLKGELILILDERCSASLCGYRLTYNRDDGLICKKEDEGNG